MSIDYRIDAVSTDGTLYASAINFIDLTFDLLLNESNEGGDYEIGFLTNEPKADLPDDALLVAWRYDSDFDTEFKPVFVGIHRAEHMRQRLKANADTGSNPILESYISSGTNALDILRGSAIWYPATSPQVDKSGDAFKVMYDYAVENIGSLATIVNGRFADNVHANVTIPLPPVLGVNYEAIGVHKDQNLLEVFRIIADYCKSQGVPIVFEMVWTGGYNFRLDIREPSDLRGGNSPVVLGVEYGNVSELNRVNDRAFRKTSTNVRGNGVGTEQRNEIVTRIPDTVTPSSNREITIDANEADTDQSLIDQGDAYLESVAFLPQFTVKPRRANKAFLVAYSVGDLVTLDDLKDIYTVSPSFARVNYSNRTESIEVEIETIAKQ